MTRGKFTIFTLEDCRHCKRTKAAFAERQIPYVDINLTKYPEKRNDMLTLSDRLTVPQVFLNEEHLGGADEIISLFKEWDEKLIEEPTFYKSAFTLEIEGPTDPRLLPPTYAPRMEELSTPAPVRNDKTFQMPDGSFTSILKVTELLKRILPRETLSHNFTQYRHAFTGKQAVQTLQQQFKLKDENEGLAFGRSLQENFILDHVVGEHLLENKDKLYYRLQCDQTPSILNSYRVWTEPVDPDSMRLVKRLKKMLNKILSKYTGSDGKVDYKQAAKDKDFPAVEEATCELQGVDYRSMPRNTMLAFSINLYNFMIKYAFTKVGIGHTDLARYSFFNKVMFKLGPDVFSFNDFENGILRGNRKAPFAISSQLSKGDPRLDLAFQDVDCRIHFALNCGAKSCPPVKNFTSTNIEEELRIVSQAFCEDESQVRVDLDKGTIYLSKILSWYQEDFGKSKEERLKTVAGFLRGKKLSDLELLLKKRGEASKVKYNEYDWSTDASDYVPFSNTTVKGATNRLLRGISYTSTRH